MARLVSIAKITTTTTTNIGASADSVTTHTCLMRVVAPANQKLAVRFRTYGRGTSATGPHVRFTVRRGSSTTGATTAALTLAKSDGQDAETLQATAFEFTVQPTNVGEANNGTIVDQFVMHPQSSGMSKTIVVNGGETLTLWGITTTAVAVDAVADIEE